MNGKKSFALVKKINTAVFGREFSFVDVLTNLRRDLMYVTEPGVISKGNSRRRLRHGVSKVVATETQGRSRGVYALLLENKFGPGVLSWTTHVLHVCRGCTFSESRNVCAPHVRNYRPRLSRKCTFLSSV